MLKVVLDEIGVQELKRLRRDKSLLPVERDRLEMLALSDSGWSVGEIARRHGYCEETVRRVFRRYRSEGLSAIKRQKSGPEPDLKRRGEIERVLGDLFSRSRTWTARQVALALLEQTEGKIRLSTRQTRKHLVRMASWKRVKRSVSHKQDEEKVALAKEELAFFSNDQKQES